MIALAYTLSIVGMVLLPIILAILLRRHYRVYWILFIVGTLTFLLSQAIHLPLNEWLTSIGVLPDNPELNGAPLWRSALIFGLTAGLCEELVRASGYLVIKWARRFEDGVMLGLGHGGIEAMIFGGVLTAATVSSLLNLRGVNLEYLNLSAVQLEALTLQFNLFSTNPLFAFAPLLERTFAIGAQVLFSILVLKAFTHRKPLYLLVAILLHTLVDAVAVYVAVTTEEIWVTWVALLGILIPGWVWLILQWRHRNQEIYTSGERSPDPGLLGEEARLFLASIRKEFLYQWRTRRILILCAVFIAFSIMSPLLTKFTPQMLSAIEGAEMFADLIPDMTLSDALAQHIETITQFGFILVILLGMGAVAGEKESGIAAVILSKPIPRWIYLNSKFSAQSIVYALSFFLAVIAGYYYTTILFGNLDLGVYIGINALLLLWMLVIAAVTLLGSTLGKSTGAAAGFSLGGSIFLLLAGSLPRISALMPSGLLGWAAQLGAPDHAPANWGAVTLSIVIILFCLISALGIFERQELQ
jgi:ABC-2 type transport system permease protein